MLASVLHMIGGQLSIEHRELPSRKQGESLINVKAAIIGHLDNSIASGSLGVHPEFPYIPGVEASGVVVQSDSFLPGTGVVIRGAGVGVFQNGTWAEYISVNDQALMPMAREFTFELAAGYFVPTTTAYIAVHDIGKVSAKSAVLVTGVRGAVGSLAAEMCLNVGARVVGMSRDVQSPLPNYLSEVEIWDYSTPSLGDASIHFDLVVDTVAGSGFSERLSMVQSGGVVALVGYAAGEVVEVGVPGWILSDTPVVPVNMLNRETRAREVSELLATDLTAGRLHLQMTEFSHSDLEVARLEVSLGRLHGRAFVSFDG